jgi:drug/metabolite transporter (DMT)-like permease
VANVGYLIPIVAVLIGFFFLDEQITLMTFLAMLIILLSLYVTRRAGIKLRKIND